MRHTIINRILFVACAAAAVAVAGGCGHSSTVAPAVAAPQATPPSQQLTQMQNATEAAAEKAHANMAGAKNP